MSWKFAEYKGINEEELAKIHQEMMAVAEKLYNDYGPEGTYDLINILTAIMNADLSSME